MKVRSGEAREWLASIALPLLFEEKGRLCCSWNREMEAVRALSNTYRRRKSDGTVSALWEIFRLPLRHAFYTERPESFHSRTPTSLKKRYEHFRMYTVLCFACLVHHKTSSRNVVSSFAVFLKNVTRAKAPVCCLDKYLHNKFSKLFKIVRRAWN